MLAKSQICLETHQVIGALFLILGTQLNRRPGTTSGTRVGKADGLHSAKADSILAGTGDLLGGLTGLEEVATLKVLEHNAVGGGERLDKGLVLLLIERSVEIVAAPLLLVARLREQYVHIERGGIDDWRGSVKERQGVATDELHDLFTQCRRTQRARGNDHVALGNLRDLAVHDLNTGSSGNLGLDKLGKLDAVDRQGTARGNGRTMGTIEQHRTHTLELGL